MTVPSTCGSAQRARNSVRCCGAEYVRCCGAEYAALRSQNNKDAVKLRPAGCMRHPDLPKAAGSYCSESCPAS